MVVFRLPFRAGRLIVGTALTASCGVLCAYAYKRFVLLDPFKIVKDETGVYRWQTRLEHIDERLNVRNIRR
jgi:hypothetical protein